VKIRFAQKFSLFHGLLGWQDGGVQGRSDSRFGDIDIDRFCCLVLADFICFLFYGVFDDLLDFIGLIVLPQVGFPVQEWQAFKKLGEFPVFPRNCRRISSSSREPVVQWWVRGHYFFKLKSSSFIRNNYNILFKSAQRVLSLLAPVRRSSSLCSVRRSTGVPQSRHPLYLSTRRKLV